MLFKRRQRSLARLNSDALRVVRVYIMENPDGEPDKEGLSNALREARVSASMLPVAGISIKITVDKKHVSKVLKIVPDYGYVVVMAGSS